MGPGRKSRGPVFSQRGSYGSILYALLSFSDAFDPCVNGFIYWSLTVVLLAVVITEMVAIVAFRKLKQKI